MRIIRKWVWVLCGALAIYSLSYCFNSSLGGYWVKPEMDGQERYSFGLAMPAAILWQPRWGHKALGQTDLLGVSYAPLIWLDRRCVHSTIHLSDDDGFQRVSHLARAQIHPEFRDMSDKFQTNSQPSAPANGRQLLHSETNRTSAAAGSRR